MKIQTIFFTLLSICFLASCTIPNQTISNNNNPLFTPKGEATGPKNAKPGACYAKCLMASTYLFSQDLYPVYTGDDPSNEFVEETKVVTAKASTKWVQKKGDRKCLSPDPNDCLVWCLVEIPEESFTLQVVTDTVSCKNYTIEKVETKTLKKKGGHTEWKEVLCAEKIDSTIIASVQEALRTNGYDPGPSDNVLGPRTKAALTRFQKDKSLPVGQLDFESLDALGVAY